jgi:putative hydrolase of HD superfamily
MSAEKQGADDTGMQERLAGQIAFLLEMDRLKAVLRRTPISDRSRKENSAEHSWHAALAAAVLAEHAAEEIDAARAVKMLLVHDVVEIDAGDTFCYDKAGQETRHERETAAAERLFGMLPEDQARDMRALWDEFEARETPEARFAAALDRVLPLLVNYRTSGAAWREHGITYEEVIERNRHIEAGAPLLWKHVKSLIDDAAAKGWLARLRRENR